ncbi:MAG: hypothetical protein SPJ13_02975 [Bacteroidales bacterium]|nr:hypothetical protein [Bacteroidales bacterium]
MILLSSFASQAAWSGLLQFFLIAAALLVANVVRRKVGFMRRSLMPTALIAGIIILLLKLFPWFDEVVNKDTMEILTYHCLGLGFVALALKNNRIESRSSGMKVTETGAVTANVYVVQGIIGLLVSIPLYLWWNRDTFFYASGLLLPMGYGQGPGQALNMGTVFAQGAADQGIRFSGGDFGLSIAAIGFLVGSVIGVVYMNILRRRGRLKMKGGEYQERYTLSDYEEQNEIPNTESIDKLTIQVSLVAVVYGLVYALMWGVQQADLGNFGTKTLKPLVWGFNFLWGTLLGVLAKNLLNGFKKARLMSREYINNFMLNRISGLCFDLMIVAGTAAISFQNLSTIWLPLLAVCTVGAVATFHYLRRVCHHLYPDYEYEGFFSLFGMLTGTASNGMILLREIDPKFETPAANNLVLQTIPAIAFGFPILLLMGFAPLSLKNTLATLAILLAIFVAFNLFLFRTKIFKKKVKP